MHGKLVRVTYCTHVDDAGNKYFSVEEFIRGNNLPDTGKVRQAVREISQEDPEVLILEDMN